MTDKTPAGSATPKRTTAAKSAATAKTTDAPKTPAPKTSSAKAPAAKVPAAKKPATTVATPVEATPVAAAPAVVAAPVAVAPAGWYPVSAGSPQQRWWDGTGWTEHVHDPAATRPIAQTPVEHLTAPAGTKPATVWFWLLAVGVPVLQLLQIIPVAVFISQLLGSDITDSSSVIAAEFTPAYLVVALSGWFIWAVCIVFAVLDWRELKARGIPKPFHWAWSFFVIVVGWPAVYMIGRTVIAKRRTGTGVAPLWVFIALQVVAFVATVVVVSIALVQFVTLLGDGLSTAGNIL